MNYLLISVPFPHKLKKENEKNRTQLSVFTIKCLLLLSDDNFTSVPEETSGKQTNIMPRSIMPWSIQPMQEIQHSSESHTNEIRFYHKDL